MKANKLHLYDVQWFTGMSCGIEYAFILTAKGYFTERICNRINKEGVESRAIHVQASDVHMSGTSNRCGNIWGCTVYLLREVHQKFNIQLSYWCWPHGYPLTSHYQNSRLSEDSRCSLYIIWPVLCELHLSVTLKTKVTRSLPGKLASTPSVNGNLKLSIACGKCTRM